MNAHVSPWTLIGGVRAFDPLPQARPHGNPDDRQVLGHTLIGGLVGAQPTHLGQRPVNHPEDLPEADLGSRASQRVTTAGAPVR